jgi:ParB family chromosome partitioning protein
VEQAAATVRGEGWKWVEIMPDLDWESTKGFGHAEADRLPPSAGQQQEIDKLTAEGKAITAEHGEEPEDEEACDRLWEIQRRIEDLSEGDESWPDKAKAIGIDHDGALDIRRGLIRPEDKAAAKKAGKARKVTGSDTGKKDGPLPFFASGCGDGWPVTRLQ